jgi:predicted nucleotidyltransferase
VIVRKLNTSTIKGVSRYAIRKLAKAIAERFEPQCIILFGSQATGTSDEESDVDLLVVMETKNEISQAVRIREATEHPFPLDLLVRTPTKLKQRVLAGDWFLREIVEQGKVLYGRLDEGMGPQGGSRLARRKGTGKAKSAAD